MDRPTKEQVDLALAEADAAERDAAPLRRMLGGMHWPAALAAEVRALREQIEAVQAFAKAQDATIGRMREERSQLRAAALRVASAYKAHPPDLRAAVDALVKLLKPFEE